MSAVEEPLARYWFVYIATARTGRLYVGITTNPVRRLKEHNSHRGSRFAINQGPFKLSYISPPFASQSEARTREVQLKGWSREKKQKLINGIYK